MRLTLVSSLIMVWLSVLAELPTATAASDESPPIFFVTDREQRTGKSALHFGAQKNDPLDHVTYGAIACRRRSVDRFTAGPVDQWSPQPDRIYREFPEFADSLRTAIGSSDRGGVVVFVHGCCIGFREAIRQASRLRNHVKATVILYDWGSPFGSYSGSLLTHPRSQERFNCFMKAMAQVFRNERITIVGLSMGNILIENFLLQHRPAEIDKTFDQVIFARADIDSIAFKSHLPRISDHARQVFVYVDNRDFLINLSHALRMLASPTAHGQRVGRLTKGLQAEQPVMFVDVSPLNLRHALPYGVVSDLLASDGALPSVGQYKYVELATGLVQARPK